jgi:endoglucanase
MVMIGRVSAAVGSCALAVCGGLALASETPPASPFIPAPAAVPTRGATLRLGKCVNLSNMLEAPTEGAWGRAFRDSDMDVIAAKGFTGIRLPARFSAHAGREAPYTVDASFLKRVHHIVDLATARGIAVIVDNHHYADDAIFQNPLGEAPRFAAIWRQIAVSFKDAPASVYFELINEPHDKFDASNLMAVQAPALAAVRESNPTRPVVIDGSHWASIADMLTMQFPDDPNVVPTFHYYDPANFGFDKAPWMNPAVRETFGSSTDVAELRDVLKRLQGFMRSTGRVPFAGELGANEARAVDQRAIFYNLTSTAFASIGVQSCAWGYTNTHQLYRDGSGWEPGIADGLATVTDLKR